MKEIKNYNKTIFESIKHIDEEGREYWSARELQKVLEYSSWQKFMVTIENSMITCINSNHDISDHFNHMVKMITIGKGGKRKIIDYKLSRYACYLIVQNGDSKKETIALGQTYFAYQTRKQELLEEYEELTEDEKRLQRRKQTKKYNLSLNRTAVKSGVKDLARFHNAGYKGLYNGENADDIAKRKGLRYREEILDNMSSVELGANIFRITQTEDKLKREKVDNEYTANSIHFEVGKKVRQTIKELGGTMPEELQTPNKSIKEIENEKK